MGLFSPNPNKLKQIELQNLLFDTEEKKLMVSVDFLNDMKNRYISKRIKNVDKMANGIIATKSPKNFFTYYDSMMKDLDELIVLEKYHNFKKPVPSEFKKNMESKMERYTESMINRAWKNASQQIGLGPNGKRSPTAYTPILDEMLQYQEKYTPALLDLIDKFYISVFDESFRKQDEPEPEDMLEETAEADETEAENEAAEDIEGLPDEDDLVFNIDDE